MGAYLDALGPDVWNATKTGFTGPLTTEQLKWNAKARNAIIEGISEDVFARIDNIDLAHDMWLQLIQLHEGSTKVREQKYHLLRAKYDEFKMLPNECCNDMFSRLNLIVKELNALNVSNLDKGMINRKILMLLPKPKYNIINSMLQKEDLDEMDVVELVGEIRAHEMSVLGISEEATPSKSIALKAKTKKNSKLKMIKHESSSSEQDDDSSNDEDDDQELALLMRKFSRLSDKIGKKGYSFDPNKRVFRPRRDDKNKTCYNCGEKGHISPNCSKPDKRKSSSKNKQVQESSDDEEDNHKGKNKNFERKKSYNKKSKNFTRKKGNLKRSFVVGTQEWVTDVSSSEDESSEDDDIVGVAITNHETPLPPPPMCLMAKGNSKVSDGESDESDDELDPNEFSNLIHEYTCIIKREKSKVKKLESAHASLESSHNDLLAKYNALLKEHDESLVLSKQVSDQYDKLKIEHVDLRQKYNFLELAYEALEDNLEQASKIEPTKIVKVNASTSCDDLPNELVYTIFEKSATNPSLEYASCSTKGKEKWTHLESQEKIVKLEIREMELLKQVESLESSMKKLTRGEHKHKEMLFHHARDYGKKGLGSFPEVSKSEIHSPEVGPSFIKNFGSYCQHCQVTGHHTRECPLPNIPLPTLPKNSTMYENNHFLLSKVKGQVKARFIGNLSKNDRKKLPKQIWVPKALITHVQGPKLSWVPKTKA